jgi:Cd2+/Zn2+-exporting ATPase
MYVNNLISGLISEIPPKIKLKDGNVIHPKDAKLDDVYLCCAGDELLLDGKVSLGKGLVDESSLTGEFMPKEKILDSVCYSGTILTNGYIEICVTKLFDESQKSTINKLIEEVSGTSSESEETINRFAN